jgi:hypothetical protein
MRYLHKTDTFRVENEKVIPQTGTTYNVGNNRRKRKERKAKALAKAISKLMR